MKIEGNERKRESSNFTTSYRCNIRRGWLVEISLDGGAASFPKVSRFKAKGRAVKCENRVNFSSTRTVLIRKYPEAGGGDVRCKRRETAESNKYTIRKRRREGGSTLNERSARPQPSSTKFILPRVCSPTIYFLHLWNI